MNPVTAKVVHFQMADLPCEQPNGCTGMFGDYNRGSTVQCGNSNIRRDSHTVLSYSARKGDSQELSSGLSHSYKPLKATSASLMHTTFLTTPNRIFASLIIKVTCPTRSSVMYVANGTPISGLIHMSQNVRGLMSRDTFICAVCCSSICSWLRGLIPNSLFKSSSSIVDMNSNMPIRVNITESVEARISPVGPLLISSS